MSAKCRQTAKRKGPRNYSRSLFVPKIWQEREDSNPRPLVLETCVRGNTWNNVRQSFPISSFRDDCTLSLMVVHCPEFLLQVLLHLIDQVVREPRPVVLVRIWQEVVQLFRSVRKCPRPRPDIDPLSDRRRSMTQSGRYHLGAIT